MSEGDRSEVRKTRTWGWIWLSGWYHLTGGSQAHLETGTPTCPDLSQDAAGVDVHTESAEASFGLWEALGSRRNRVAFPTDLHPQWPYQEPSHPRASSRALHSLREARCPNTLHAQICLITISFLSFLRNYIQYINNPKRKWVNYDYKKSINKQIF